MYNEITNLEKIKKLLDDSIYFEILVSYTRYSGISQLFDLNKEYKGKIISTTLGYISDPKGITSLDKITKYKVYNNVQEPLHAKTYYIETKTQGRWLITGSINISNHALNINLENAIFINETNNSFTQELNNFRSTFNKIWNDSLSIELSDFNIEEYKDKFSFVNKKIESIKNIVPKKFQIEAIENLRNSRREDFKKSIIVASTGVGKTYLAAFDIQQFSEHLWKYSNKRIKVLFVVHRTLILKAAKRAFDNIFKGHRTTVILNSNLIKNNEYKNYDIIFSTDKTCSQNLKRIPKNYFDYIVIDEAHRSRANLEKKIIDYFQPKFLLGLTATPERMDGKDVFENFDYKIAFEINLSSARKKDLICPFNYYSIPYKDKVIDVNSEYKINKNNLLKIAKNILKNIEKFKVDIFKSKTLIFVSKIEDAKLLEDALNNISNLKAASLYSGQNDYYIENKINQFRFSDLNIIIGVDMFNEGVDIPEIDTIVFYRPTESKTIFLQQLGRGLRKLNDKKLRVFDFIGNDKKNFSTIEALGALKYEDKLSLIKKTRDLVINNKENNLEDFPGCSLHLDKESADKIINSISKYYSIYAKLKESLQVMYDTKGKIPSLIEIHEYENIIKPFDIVQILKKERSTLELFSNLNFYSKDKEKFTEKELEFYAAFERFSISASTLKQRKIIINLLKGNIIENLDDNWNKWLSGKTTSSIKRYKQTNFIENLDNNKIKLNFNIKNIRLKEKIIDLINYLEYLNNNNINYYLKIGKNYHQDEILFMHNANNSFSFRNTEAQITIKPLEKYIFKLNQGHDVFSNKILWNKEKTILEFYTKSINDKHQKILKDINNNIDLFFYMRPNKDSDKRFVYLGTNNTYKIINDNMDNGKKGTMKIHQELSLSKEWENYFI